MSETAACLVSCLFPVAQSVFFSVFFSLISNVFIVSLPLCKQQLGSDGSRPVLIQVAESVYRFALGSVAGGKSHAPLAPCIPSSHHPPTSPTCLPAYLPPTPTLCCPHKKRVRERGQWPLYCPLLCLQEQWLLPCLKRSAPSLSCSRSISLYLFPSFYHPSLSRCPVSPSMGKPSCVDSFVPV